MAFWRRRNLSRLNAGLMPASESGAVATDGILAGVVATDGVLAGAVATDGVLAGAVATGEVLAGAVATDGVLAGAVAAALREGVLEITPTWTP